jgi:ectoine hydroxylase-related dioxygenase (phytanoyl-CoA dioxygenase family)
MCGVWVALEDMSEGAGPLEYYPGSHKWPIL